MEPDLWDESVCFASAGKLIVRFSALNSEVDWAIEEAKRVAETELTESELSELPRLDQRFSSKLSYLRALSNSLMRVEGFTADWSRWAADVRAIQYVRDDIGHGAVDLSVGYDEPSVRIENRRPRRMVASYVLSAGQIDHLSLLARGCCSWLRMLVGCIQNLSKSVEDSKFFYKDYPEERITNLFPDRAFPWVTQLQDRSEQN